MYSDVQRVIVYRNPLEAALWENDALWPTFGGIVVAIAVTLMVLWVLDWFHRRVHRLPFNHTWVAIIVAACSLFGTFKYMGVL